MALRALLLSAMVAGVAGLSSAQSSPQGSFSASASFSAPPQFAMPVVADAPYAAEEVSENVTTLADGTHFTRKMPVRKIWRDSQGRTRSERSMGMGPRQDSMPVIIEIMDPVAGFKYVLDEQKKVAHRQTLPAQGTRPNGLRGGMVGSVIGGGGGGRSGEVVAGPRSSATPASAPQQPHFSNESLGTRTIDGVFAEGTRNTVTYPVGMMGNDREFSTVTESWVSPDLKVRVMSKTTDPRNGENTIRLENLSRSQPEPTLFMPPADYTVVDEAGAFTIDFSRP